MPGPINFSPRIEVAPQRRSGSLPVWFLMFVGAFVHFLEITYFNFSLSGGIAYTRGMLHMMVLLVFFFVIHVSAGDKVSKHHLFMELLFVWILAMFAGLLGDLFVMILAKIGAGNMIGVVFQALFNAFLLPLWVYYMLFFQTYMPHDKGTVLLGVIILILIMIIVPFYIVWSSGMLQTFGYEGASAEQRSMAGAWFGALKDGVPHFISTIRNAPTTIAKNSRDFLNQTLNPNFETRVETTQGRSTGIKLDPIEGVSGLHYTNQPLILYSVLRGSTLDVPVDVRLSCLAGKDSQLKEKTIPGVVTDDTVVVTSVQSRPFVCEFPAYSLNATGYHIRLDATFPFITSSYIKRYVIDKDRFESMQSQSIDPFEQYAITDRNPKSFYTPGPVKLGVATLDPLIVLPADEKSTVDLAIRLENSFGWEGSIENVDAVAVMIPKGFTIMTDYTKPGGELRCTAPGIAMPNDGEVCGCEGDGLCINDCNDFNLYAFFPTIEKSEYGVQPKIFINCKMEAEPSSVHLQNRPISIASFRAVAIYNYTLSKKTQISMRKSNSDSGTTDHVEFCGYRPATELYPSIFDEVRDYDHMSEVRDKQGGVSSSCFPLLFGIIRQSGNHFSSQAGCVGTECGITQYTKEMLDDIKDHITLPRPFDEFDTWTPQEANSISLAVSSNYIDRVLVPLCADADRKAECIIGKYKCGKAFVFGDYNSCVSRQACYYCNDQYVQEVLSYAYGYELANS